MNREIIEKIFISIVFGLIGFLVNFIPINFYFPPQKATFLFGLIFPMIITLAWGWKYGLLASTLGMGCQTMWFLWLPTSGWGSVISIPPFTLWIIWHGWCADQHRKKRILWSKLYLAEVPFRIFNIIILYTVFRFLFQFNPPPWAPGVSNTVVPLEYVNFIIVKEIINAYLVLITCDAVLNLDKVRAFFKLEKKSEHVKTNYISSVSIIIGVLFWITDGFLSYLIFEPGGGSIIDLIILNVPIHNLFTRIIFLASCLIVGLILSNFFNKEQESQIIIQEQEKRFKDVAENILEWIWETDANGKYTYSSPVVKVLLGYKHPEVLNRYFYDFLHPKDREQLKKITFDIFAKKKSYFEFIGKYEHKNGKMVWLSTRGIAILDEKGELLGFKGTNINVTTHKKVEEELRIKNTAFSASLSAQSIADVNGIINHVNPAFIEMWGYKSKEEAIGNSVGSFFVNPDDAVPVFEALTKAGKWKGEFLAKRCDGSTFISQGFASAIHNENGDLIGFQSANLNISKRKEAEENVQKEIEKAKMYLDIAAAIIIVLNSDGLVELINKKGGEILGYNEEQLIGKNWFDNFIPKENKDEMKSVFWKLMAGELESVEYYENSILTREGIEKIIAWHNSILKDEQGIIIGILSSGEDITERKKIQGEIASLARFPLENPYPVLRVTKEKVIYLNNAGRTIFGIKEGDTLPEPVSDVVAEAVDRGVIKVLELELNNRIYSFSITPIKEEEYTNIYGRDITERKKAEQDLLSTLEHLKRVNIELERFAYVASHDLQEPLRMIVSFIQLLEKRYKDKLDEDADDFIAFIVDGAKRMQTLINDLLVFSRIGRSDLTFKLIDNNVIIDSVINNLKKSIEETNATITHDPLPTIVANESEFIQLLQNLISNAIKFHKEEELPVVHISAKLHKNQWIFSVRDNGIGIDPQFFDRIFIIFQHLHKKSEYEGTGIGLAICKKIIECHRGKIWVESEVGKGSTFYFSIPKTEVRK